jgi:hypothetical protein
MATLGENSVIGTKVKLNISLPPIDGYHLADVDWSVLVFTEQGLKTLTVDKKNAIYIDKDNYVIRVDTSLVGAGTYYTTLTAYIPDTDFEDGIRPEKRTRYTGVIIDPR